MSAFNIAYFFENAKRGVNLKSKEEQPKGLEEAGYEEEVEGGVRVEEIIIISPMQNRVREEIEKDPSL